jgi:hypothetical protein
METKPCSACGNKFKPRSQVPNQSYCPNKDCQRTRRRRWQSAKLQNDSDYRDNQIRANQSWNKRNPDYWKEYRELNQEYVDRNRVLQRERNEKRNKTAIVKMDVSDLQEVLPSGVYRVIRLIPDAVAKMDAWIVKIDILSGTSNQLRMIAKR